VVPVHEGEDDDENAIAPKKKSTSKKAIAKKKGPAKRKISGKETGLPVDVEAEVEQGEASKDESA